MERGRATKVVMLLFFCLFLACGLVIDGKYASVSAEPHNGKQAGMAKERPEVDRSGIPVMDIHLATQAGTVVQMSNCTEYWEACHQGDWINNNWLVYHSREDYHLYKTDGVSIIPLPWSGGSECDSHPDVNDAGSLIAFQRLVYPGGNYCSELWVMDTNGGNQKRMVACSPDVGGAHEPKWSPDGMYIAYTQGVLDHEYKDLCAIAYPSGGPIRLTSRPYANPQHGLQWLSTASRRSAIPTPPVVLSSQVTWADLNADGDRDGGEYTRDIAKTTLTGGNTWLTDNTDDWCNLMPVPTSTGKIVYMSDIGGYGDLYIMSQDGTSTMRLTDSSDRSYCSNHPAPMPNGKYIAYWSEDGDGTWRIWMMTADGKYKGVVVDGPIVNDQEYGHRTLKFNPAGTKLLFNGCTVPDSYYCITSNVYSLNLDTADTDGDKLKNFEEAVCQTNPLARDTDGGGEDDYAEFVAGRDPLDPTDDRLVAGPVVPGLRSTP
ncbi:MAG: hypothetical protein ACOYVJ_01505 [Nitrospirota bacterium]